MQYGELGHEVAVDYRLKIIADWDSPILAYRANRDRYPAGHRYAGATHLGSSHSEEAITWNVFRGFQNAGQLDVLAQKVGMSDSRALLIWGVAPEPGADKGVLQFVTGGLLREIDGAFPGQMAEPDVVLLGSNGVVVGVAPKLSEQEDARQIWGGRLNRVRHLRKRLSKYEEEHPFSQATGAAGGQGDNPGILKQGTPDQEVAAVYHLVKMALLAKQLGTRFDVEPAVVALTSTRQWFEKATETGESASDLWDKFVGMLGRNSPRCDVVFWQHIPRLIKDDSLVVLKTIMLRNPLLYDVAEERMPGW